MRKMFRYTNWWNVVAVVLAIQAFIGNYGDGLFAAFQGVILVAALVMLGRASLDRELEIALNKVKDEMAREDSSFESTIG